MVRSSGSGQTVQPDVFVCGEVTGPMSAEEAARHGARGPDGCGVAYQGGAIRPKRRLSLASSARLSCRKSALCPCEDVTLADVEQAISLAISISTKSSASLGWGRGRVRANSAWSAPACCFSRRRSVISIGRSASPNRV